VLRDPVERVLSHFQSKHPGLLQNGCDNCSNVEGFAIKLATGIFDAHGFENLQTRMLAGDGF
jgi:hypothetical protein